MQLDLKNIGIIKKASVKLDGLTVIAGENDTGKSTVGKALTAMYGGISAFTTSVKNINNEFSVNIVNFYKYLFKQEFLSSQKITLKTNFAQYSAVSLNTKISEGYTGDFEDQEIKGITFIETPMVWNLQDFFNASTQIESQLKMIGDDINIPYPFLMKTLHFQLHTKRKVPSFSDNVYSMIFKTIKTKLFALMGGEFIRDEHSDIFYFHRDDKVYDLINVATGIKYFGLLQVLLDNNRLNLNTILILDEPEVHLHPKWQLKMAELIVELVKNGVKILVNSHSPYMIEALQRYSELEKIEDKSNFYLAQNGAIDKIEDSNSRTLSEIFEKLSEPFDIFDEMDSKKLQNG
ncbi:MAG: AAA family ATPase [Arcobacteraceae bacterium]|nr:AAA family ATPase [Arcobacteraceae bacterium]